jgi:7-carboxy-7-deazaguanine synthase
MSTLGYCGVMSEVTLRITEIFYSLQGESRTVGCPTVFVRLTGCPLRCGYCDSEYAFYGGRKTSLDEIISQVSAFKPRFVCVTGGEPLAQPNCQVLLSRLCDQGYEVSLETSGALPVNKVDSRVVKVVDLKTPGSGEVNRNCYDNIAILNAQDQVKFVICDRQDYEWARFKMTEYQLDKRVDEVLFSPCHGLLSERDLADWILQDNLCVRFQVQLHKQLWGDKPGH